MNLTLGGTLLAVISHLSGGGRRDDSRTALAGRLMAVNTYGISLTITTGVAPLLFIQVLYQQFFYTATILIGWVWFGLLVAADARATTRPTCTSSAASPLTDAAAGSGSSCRR